MSSRVAHIDLSDLSPFLTALAIGIVIGAERESSHRRSERPALAGARTFAVIGLTGALAARAGVAMVVAGGILVGLLFLVVYVREGDRDPGITTEIAGLATYLLGALAEADAGLAAALAALLGLVLVSRDRIRTFTREVVTEREIEDLIRFFVVAAVVLPLLPDDDIGPYGALNPQRIWTLVVAISAISFLGYVAVRALGSGRGLLVTGFAGGFVSASATTAAMGRVDRTSASGVAPLAGALLASVATLLQLGGVVAIVDRDVFVQLLPALVAGSIVLVVEVLAKWRGLRSIITPGPLDSSARPFALLPALILAAVLTAALLLSRWVADVVGTGAVVAISAATGFADAQSGALAAATLASKGDISTDTAVWASAASLGTNTITKCVVAFAAGGWGYGWRFARDIALPSAVVGAGVAFSLR
ncbi:MAG: MgtC/SapB family protein [Acidimicrobiales bacterium]|nr:MgtC/SapB family protein [Acidimicrobiales bacterium]